MALGVHHSELAVLFQNVEVTVSLHGLGKKPMLTPWSLTSWLLTWVAFQRGCGDGGGGNAPKVASRDLIMISCFQGGLQKESSRVVKIGLRAGTTQEQF